MLPSIIGDTRSIVAVVLGLLQLPAVYAVSILTELHLYYWLVVPAVVEVCIILIPIYFLPRWLRWSNTQAIGVLLRMIRDPIERAAPNDDVRCSIFRLSLSGKYLIEAVMCTKAGLATRKNKYMSIYQGVAGMAYRTKRIRYVPIQGDWELHLMRDLGFTEEELKTRFRGGRGSYLGVPILKRDNEQEVEVLAVLCLDSNSDATFTDPMIAEIEKFAPYIADVIT